MLKIAVFLPALIYWLFFSSAVYTKSYEKPVNPPIIIKDAPTPTPAPPIYRDQKVSWYATGKNADGTAFNPDGLTGACWAEYPRGTRFKVTRGNNSIVITCNDRGRFKELGRMLDLSSGAFIRLAPLSKGVIKVNIEVLK